MSGQFMVGQKVYATRSLLLQELAAYRVSDEDNRIVVSKDEPGKIVEIIQNRIYVHFDEDVWMCNEKMIDPHPSLRKRYVESLLIDHIAVYFLDRLDGHMGEIIFYWKSGELYAEIAIASFGAVAYAQDIFAALGQKSGMEYKAFVDLLNSLGYVGDEL